MNNKSFWINHNEFKGRITNALHLGSEKIDEFSYDFYAAKGTYGDVLVIRWGEGRSDYYSLNADEMKTVTSSDIEMFEGFTRCYQLYLEIAKIGLDKICLKCRSETKERHLFMSTYVGCMC